MHRMSNSDLWHLIQRAHRTLNKTAQDAIQRAMRTSNIIIVLPQSSKEKQSKYLKTIFFHRQNSHRLTHQIFLLPAQKRILHAFNARNKHASTYDLQNF